MNEFQAIKKAIQDVIGENNLSKTILFGSRARGEDGQDSDYDLLIITKRSLEQKEMRGIRSVIHKRLVKELLEPFDILIKPESEVAKFSQIVGTVSYNALKEGIVL